MTLARNEKVALDIGELAGPVLIFGGPYSNLQALLAMQQIANEREIPPSNIICTGDIIAYCGNPIETLNTIKDWGIHVVKGNCEDSFANNADDCGCGFAENSSCSILSIDWYQFANRQLTQAQREWQKKMPDQIRFSHNNHKYLCVHGSIEQSNQFVFASTSAILKEKQLTLAKADVVIGGHCGIAFGQKLSNGYWLNAGVIGMPANDGQEQTWYMLIDQSPPPNKQTLIQWHRLPYDIAAAQQAMKIAKLPCEYHDALQSGIWPSTDVLPDIETKQQGKARSIPPLLLEPC